MRCSSVQHKECQQAVFWRGTSSSPVQVLRQLESAVLQSTHRVQGLCVRQCNSAAAMSLCRSASAGQGVPNIRRIHSNVTCNVVFSSHGVGSHTRSQQFAAQHQPSQHMWEHQPDVGKDTQQQRQQQQAQPQPKQQQQQPRHTLRHLLNIHVAPSRQQQQPQPSDTARLARKLTSVLSDSTTSPSDVADVLLVAERCGCLNALHVAAALARLVRLDAAATAAGMQDSMGYDDPSAPAAAAAAAEGPGDEVLLTAVVPLLGQPRQQGQMVKDTAAGILARSRSSRWHTAAAAAAMEAVQGTTLEVHLNDEEQQEQQQHLVEQLSTAAEQLWPSMNAATITSCCWAFAHLQYEPSPALLQLAAAALVDMASSLVPGSKRRHTGAAADGAAVGLTSAGSGAASLLGSVTHPAQLPQDLLEQQQQQDLSASPRQVVLMLWALAKVTSDIDGLVVPQQQTLPPQQQQEQPACEYDVSTEPAVTPGSVSASPTTRSSSVSSSSSVLHYVLSCVTAHLPDLSSQGLLLLLWASATWTKNSTHSNHSSSQLPTPAASGLLPSSAAAMDAGALTPRGLAVVLWSVARLGLRPDATWLAAWLAATHQTLHAAGPQDLATAAWGLAHMGYPPPEDWLDAVSCRAAATAGHMGPRELPALLWAFARLRYRPAVAVTHTLLQRGGILAARGALGPQGLALLLWCCGVLGVQLPGRWVDGVLAAAAGFLPLFRPIEASALWVALVKLQHIPPTAWLDVWWAGSKVLLAEARGQQLVLLLWCAVRLGQAPPSHWMKAWLAAVQGAMSRGELTAQGYGLMWDALAQTAAATGHIPSDDWLDDFWAASTQPAVCAALDDMTVEKTLAGLAAMGRQLQQGLSLPPFWVDSFLAASLQVLPGAKLVALTNMLQAAGQLALPLPPVWLAAVMLRLQQLLLQAGVLPAVTYSNLSAPAGSSSSGGRSLSLSARLHRRWLEVCLQRVLFGLRAQQMLTPAAQRKLWYRAQQEAPGAVWGPAAAAASVGSIPAAMQATTDTDYDVPGDSRGSSGDSDALAVWPWLAAAVHSVWSDRLSAQQALQALALH